MDDDTKKIIPYINNLNNKISILEKNFNKITEISLNDQLIKETDELNKLKKINNYAYILSSLMFSYMKIINSKNLDKTILIELARVKEYMNKMNNFIKKKDELSKNKLIEKDNAKNFINNNILTNKQQPSISKKNFTNKHIKFDNDNVKENNDENSNLKSTSTRDTIIRNLKNKQNNTAKNTTTNVNSRYNNKKRDTFKNKKKFNK